VSDPLNSGISNLPFIGSILPTSSPEPIQLPGRLSYLHLPNLPSSTADLLFETLWSFLSSTTDPQFLSTLPRADVVDFDILSPQTIQVRAIWSSSPHPEGWRLNISSHEATRVEVGIFTEGDGQDKDEYALGGLRIILEENQDFEPTLFTFPHRHHILPLREELTTSLEPKYGSHPNLRTVIPIKGLVPPVNDTLDDETCGLHALYTLSKDVFVDKYQLAQLAQFESGGIKDLRGVWGETDLEEPSYNTHGWGSIVLIDIPKQEDVTSSLTVELPIHLRYLEPLVGGGNRTVDILPPEIFWACENTVEGTFTLSRTKLLT